MPQGPEPMVSAMEFHQVFDVCAAGMRYDGAVRDGVLVVIGVVLVGGISIRLRLRRSSSRYLAASGLGLLALVALLWVVNGYMDVVRSQRRLCSRLRAGDFRVVQGLVTSFQPQDSGGHLPESFTVSGVRFSFLSHSFQPGYNISRQDGSPIHDGAMVRIADIDGQIARLETSP